MEGRGRDPRDPRAKSHHSLSLPFFGKMIFLPGLLPFCLGYYRSTYSLPKNERHIVIEQPWKNRIFETIRNLRSFFGD